jgi:hypothetical protein
MRSVTESDHSKAAHASIPLSTAGPAARREAIRHKLADCAGDKSDARALAAATASIWPQLSARLVPVIGARGVDILFNRAVHLTSTSFPFMAIAGDRTRGTTHLDGLRARIGQQDASVAAAASCELLFTFTVLLASLIGDSLTDRLLGPAWALPLSESERESGL